MGVWTVPGTVQRVVDADTVVVVLDLGWRISYTAHVRVEGVDAAERNTAPGRAASQFAAGLLPAGAAVVVVSRQLDKYGRVLGAVLLPGGRNYADALVQAGHARPYP